MKLYRAVVIACLLPALASCKGASSTPTDAGPTYTCCEAADINKDYQPGQTMTVHWMVTDEETSADSPRRQVELNARLIGPHEAASDLKTAAKGQAEVATFTAEPVRPPAQFGERPVSLIRIPDTAAPGYYNLITSVIEAGSTVGSEHIIRVIPAT